VVFLKLTGGLFLKRSCFLYEEKFTELEKYIYYITNAS